MELLSHPEGSEEAGFEGGRRLRGRRASKEAAMTAQKGGEARLVWKQGVPAMRLAVAAANINQNNKLPKAWWVLD